MKARRVESVLSGPAVQRGDYSFAVDKDGTTSSLIICCPGCGNPCVLSIAGDGHPVWQWNGDKDSPTLSPSIDHVGCWHGWLKNGEFVP